MAETPKPNGGTNPFESLSRFLDGASGFNTPDVTKAQALAIGQAAIAVLIVFGFNPSNDVKNVIGGLAIALAVVLPTSDAVIRHGRASNITEIAAAQTNEDPKEPTTPAATQAQQIAEIRKQLERLASAIEPAKPPRSGSTPPGGEPKRSKSDFPPP
jgi:hypothetical protein